MRNSNRLSRKVYVGDKHVPQWISRLTCQSLVTVRGWNESLTPLSLDSTSKLTKCHQRPAANVARRRNSVDVSFRGSLSCGPGGLNLNHGKCRKSVTVSV